MHKFVSRFALMFMLLTLLLPVFNPVAAQDGRITYGETVNGTIEGGTFEIPYIFKGNEGEFVHIRMAAEDTISGIDPGIILIDADNNTLIAYESFVSAIDVFYQLPATGEYTILATRRQGRSGDTEGDFDLTLNLLPTVDKNFTESILLDAQDYQPVYYVLLSGENPITVSFENAAGNLDTYIGINQIDPGQGTLVLNAVLGGFASAGHLTMEPSSTGYHLLSLTGPSFISSFNQESRQFDLTVDLGAAE